LQKLKYQVKQLFPIIKYTAYLVLCSFMFNVLKQKKINLIFVQKILYEPLA
jgi:hypothetical protein